MADARADVLPELAADVVISTASAATIAVTLTPEIHADAAVGAS